MWGGGDVVSSAAFFLSKKRKAAERARAEMEENGPRSRENVVSIDMKVSNIFRSYDIDQTHNDTRMIS